MRRACGGGRNKKLPLQVRLKKRKVAEKTCKKLEQVELFKTKCGLVASLASGHMCNFFDNGIIIIIIIIIIKSLIERCVY